MNDTKKPDEWDLRDASSRSLDEFKECFSKVGEIKFPAKLVVFVAEMSKPGCLQFLAEKGYSMKEVDSSGEHPYYTAALAGKTENLKFLATCGVETNDQRALQGAVVNNHTNAVRTLVDLGAEPTEAVVNQALIFDTKEVATYLLIEKNLPVSDKTRADLKSMYANKDTDGTAYEVLLKRDFKQKLEEQLKPSPTLKKSKTLKL